MATRASTSATAPRSGVPSGSVVSRSWVWSTAAHRSISVESPSVNATHAAARASGARAAISASGECVEPALDRRAAAGPDVPGELPQISSRDAIAIVGRVRVHDRAIDVVLGLEPCTRPRVELSPPRRARAGAAPRAGGRGTAGGTGTRRRLPPTARTKRLERSNPSSSAAESARPRTASQAGGRDLLEDRGSGEEGRLVGRWPRAAPRRGGTPRSRGTRPTRARRRRRRVSRANRGRGRRATPRCATRGVDVAGVAASRRRRGGAPRPRGPTS